LRLLPPAGATGKQVEARLPPDTFRAITLTMYAGVPVRLLNLPVPWATALSPDTKESKTEGYRTNCIHDVGFVFDVSRAAEESVEALSAG
jgi:hypothetical protein